MRQKVSINAEDLDLLETLLAESAIIKGNGVSSLTLVAFALASAIAQSPSTYPRLLQYPDVNGSEVVYSFAGTLWISNTKTGESRQLTTTPASYPHFSKDGKTVAYVSVVDGNPDIYTIPVEGGSPFRVTYGSGVYVLQGWTPDGNLAYIEANRNNVPETGLPMFRLDTVSANGGIPTRTVLQEAALVSWVNSDEVVYNRIPDFVQNWRGYRGGTQGYLSVYNFKTNAYRALPHGHEQSLWPMVVGNDIYYSCDKNGGTLNLFKTSLNGGKEEQITHFTDEDVRWPSTDGKSVVFTQDGYLWQFDIASKNLKKLNPVIHSELLATRPRIVNSGRAVRSVSISPSGVRIAVEARGDIYSVPVRSGLTRDLTATDGPRESGPSWSPDGNNIAFISDESGRPELTIEPQMGGAKTQLTTTGLSIQDYGWSPDSKKIAFRTVHGGFYIVDVASKALTTIHPAGDPKDEFYGYGQMNWSPDSKYIAFTTALSSGCSKVQIYDLESKITHDVTSGKFQDTSVAFDKNGKYLYFTSKRVFNPSFGEFEFSLKVSDNEQAYVIPLQKDTMVPLTAPDQEEHGTPAEAPGPRPAGPRPGGPGGQMRPGHGMGGNPMGPGGPAPSEGIKSIDWDGMESRALVLPLGAGNFSGLYSSENGVLAAKDGSLLSYTLGTPAPRPLFEGLAGPFDITPDGSKLAYTVGAITGVVDLGGEPDHIGSGVVNTSQVETTIDPKKEWAEIFDEASLFIRETFYNRAWIQANWDRISDHYRTYLPDVRTRGELNTIFTGMLSELGTSHSYLEAPGDLGTTAITAAPASYLGADFAVNDGKIQLAHVYKGNSYDPTSVGPLGFPGMNVNNGDYLLAIDGHELSATDDPMKYLIDKTGVPIVIKVNSKPTLEGAREITVRPVASEVKIRYADFLNAAAAKVDELSHGQVGYVHIENTEDQGAQDFVRGFYAQTGKKALIVDERWNGGGYLATWAVDRLARKIEYAAAQRGVSSSFEPLNPALDGPKAMLINGYSGSGGDFFPWYFRLRHTGPLIGTRTWGGLVGIGAGADLVDGGSISCPGWAIYDPATNQIIAENHGISPDIEVDNSPDVTSKGIDAQLERAVQYLLDELKKHPSPNYDKSAKPLPKPQ